MKVLFCFLLLAFSQFSFAQNPGRFKNKQANNQQAANRNKQPANKATSLARFREEYEKIKASFDSADFDYAILLNDNAGLFAAKHKPEAMAKFQRMKELLETVMKERDFSPEEMSKINLDVGRTAYALGHFIFSEKRLTTSRTLLEAGGNTSSEIYQKNISSLALLATSMGRFHQAEDLFFQIRKNNTAPSYIVQNNLAVLFFNQGRYNEAETEFSKAINQITAAQLQNTIGFAIIQNNKAMLLQSLGRFDEAKQLLLNAIQIAKQLETSKANQHLKFYANLALLYQQTGNYDEAEKTYRLLENKYQRGSTEQANLLNNLAILLLVMNKHDRIEEMLKNASLIFKTNLGENSAAFAKATSDLGNFLRFKTRYAEAEPLLLKALQVREQVYGITHPLYVQSEEDLGILYWKKKDFATAKKIYSAAIEKSLDFINNYFAPMSDAEKSRYWDFLSPRFQRYFNFAIEASVDDKQITEGMLIYRAATKGLLLQSARTVSQTILNSGNKKLVTDYQQWLNQKEQLAALYVYSKAELKEQNVNLDSLLAATTLLEKTLSAASKEFSQFYFTQKIKTNELRESLPADAALVEIIRLRCFDQTLTDSIRYAALILTNQWALPELVVMNEGKKMETEAALFYQQCIKNKTTDEKSFENFWQPLDTVLKGKRKIFLSPDGIYNQVNINTVQSPRGHYLISQYDFVLISNPKDLLKKQEAPSLADKKAMLMGYPDFGSDRIPELPATQYEVDEINKLLSVAGYKVNELVQKDATETNLKQAKQVSILHIATHGYFLQNVEKIFWPIGVHTENAKENILLRSGLILAGATKEKEAAVSLDSLNNGIITAYEAMNLDLHGTRLVVLSACETGLGEIKAGEGVYGLQRAFLVAGADAVVMSLWKVDDRATQQLMNNFYFNWIKNGEKQKAFKEAQLQLMNVYKEPYYWGAFVMMEN